MSLISMMGVIALAGVVVNNGIILIDFTNLIRQEKKEHGFMKRMKTRAGRNVLKARRAKGRKKLSA